MVAHNGSEHKGMTELMYIHDLTIRMEREDDERALIRLAQLDSAWPPAGPRLLALDGDRLVAAISLADGTVISDPFEPTAAAVALLRERAAQLGFTEHRGLWRRFRNRRRVPHTSPQPPGTVRPRLQRPMA